MIYFLAPDPYREQNGQSDNRQLAALPSEHNRMISMRVLPSQNQIQFVVDWDKQTQVFAEKGIELDHGVIKIHDGAEIDTVQLSAKSQHDLSERNKSYVVKFNGNNTQYELLLENFAEEAAKLNINIVGFNYRGVGHSKQKPVTFQMLVTDGIAQAQRLLEKGVKPENITLDGHSLGGAVATMVASHFHKRGIRVYLFNDRSLAEISKMAAVILGREAYSDDVPYEIKIQKKFAIKQTLEREGWEADLAEAYLSIPPQYRRYLYVGQQSEKSNGDGVIEHEASLHVGVKYKEKQASISTGYKVYANGLFGHGHNQARAALINSKNSALTGFDIYEEFVKRKMPLK